MKLAIWTYEGPPHIGAMRVATAMNGVHCVLHAPQGDSYADLLFTMIERNRQRPPVTYSSFQARNLGQDVAALFKTTLSQAYERFQPQLLLVGASCTAELLQDDPGGLARALKLPIPVIALDLPASSKKENWGAAETFYQIVRHLADIDVRPTPRIGRRPCCNLLGPAGLGFRHRDDAAEVTKLLAMMGVDVALCAPMGASPADIARIGRADFNVVLYPEIADPAARWLERTFHQPIVRTVPLGHGATRDFITEIARVADVDPAPALLADPSRMPWWTQSVDSTYLTGKRVFIFGDATHAIAAARVAHDELGFQIAGLGTYNREFAREVHAAANLYGIEALITDDHLDVEARIAQLQPELVLGTQMERHIAKRLGIAAAVISAPVHVEDFPARYSPQMGFEGANVLFDSWVHPLMKGLEDHLLTMFRDDFEFNDASGPSHLSQHRPVAGGPRPSSDVRPVWAAEAERELGKIPFFVRGKARRNTEQFAIDRGVAIITLGTLYDAKSHLAG
ncbi:ferredoxin:protochlorophyllide reductase (ATP-dependent) subunit B [Telmatospirillum siberiense]|uniref:Light-independent protochlorophyllide reductase subunit B n=1 Tax=Telmatospirillum siberiense TaxID=382514 RepID=A0A2N3PTC1_9PROT|nr:ferredoxin:protochlorophyllide reductase (ATP-dependent) subunit B [Telmatospirillum siberiense]PKU23649.1 ferredoxin:protochlorophyllide reductase (ATP-dependent) subunit B [Telmatospirillum siberiense]